MKKIVSIIITLISIGLIIYGASYFMKEDNKNYSTSSEGNQEEKEENKESSNEESVDEPEYDPNKPKVILYLFWGNGCPHCKEAEDWLNEIYPTYGKYFEIVAYEVWYSDFNLNLMKRVGNYLGKDVEGVPFIVIGDTSYGGFAEVYKPKILNTIFSEYEKEKRVDVLKEVQNSQ